MFQKNIISYPLIRTRTCAYQGVTYVVFRKILRTYKLTDPLKKLYASVFHMLLYVRKDIAGRITLHEFILN